MINLTIDQYGDSLVFGNVDIGSIIFGMGISALIFGVLLIKKIKRIRGLERKMRETKGI